MKNLLLWSFVIDARKKLFWASSHY